MSANLLPLKPLLINNKQAQKLHISKDQSIPINNIQNTDFHLPLALTNQQTTFSLPNNSFITSNIDIINNNNIMSTFDKIVSQLIINFNKNSINNTEIESGTNCECISTPSTSFSASKNNFLKKINLFINENETSQDLCKNNLKKLKKNKNSENVPLDLSIIKRDNQNLENQNLEQSNVDNDKMILLNKTDLRKRKRNNSKSLNDNYQTEFASNDNQNLNNIKTIDHLLNKRQRLLCECGVSFSAEETLNGHKMYYCRNRILSEEEKVQTVTSIKVIFLTF